MFHGISLRLLPASWEEQEHEAANIAVQAGAYPTEQAVEGLIKTGAATTVSSGNQLASASCNPVV
jgi:hypothetical protein